MRSLQLKFLLGGLPVLLAVLACSTISPALPTLATFPPVPTATGTALPVPVATDTATPLPATAPPAIPYYVFTAAALTPTTAPAIRNLYMLNANDGWALTDTDVLRTGDGGATWYKATPAGLNGAPVAAYFMNPTIAWLAAMGADPTSGTLYHATDGGFIWSSAAVPFGGGSIMFDDYNDGWELVGLSAGMSHEAVAIYRTSDGGATWTKVFTDDPNASGSSDSLPLVGDKNGITAIDSLHAWVTGAQPSSDFIYVYATLDGGKTWAHQDLAIPVAYKGAMTGPSQPVFFGANEAVLPVLLFANNNGTDFYVSHDAGQTWSATTPVAQGGYLAVASATDFFVWDGNAPLNVSHDAGTTWSTITPNVNIKDNMDFLQFINATTGWALTADANGHSMLYETSDGGATWKVLIP